MRRIFLDTETTGLEPKLGHRIVEIGGLEMHYRRLTGRQFHYYLNPDREIDAEAEKVHGINLGFLQDKPRFAEIVDEFLDFVRGAELIIHNAPFDMAFLNAELERLKRPALETVCNGVCDTLRMARERFPGKKNSLDALCARFEVDNSRRALHGALLDAELLSDVYLAMTRGQASLGMELPSGALDTAPVLRPPGTLKILRATEEERKAHQEQLEEIEKESKGRCLWLRQAAEARGEQ